MKTVAFTFARMNPPTIGHELVVETLKHVAKCNKAHARVYLSHKTDKKKNPLQYEEKKQLATKAFGPIVYNSKALHIIDVMKDLHAEGVENVHVVVGDDRLNEFTALLERYNGKEYNFKNIHVHSAGVRDPEDASVAGVSATKLRECAAVKNVSGFKNGLPKKLRSESNQVMNRVRKGMGLNEELITERVGIIKLKTIPWDKTTNHGWWEDNDHIEVYHGTHDRNIPSIEQTGVSHKDLKTGMISVTMDPNTAHGYASMSASGGERAFRTAGAAAAVHTPESDRSVVKMRIPKQWMLDNMDKEYHGNTSMYRDKISKRDTYDKFRKDNPNMSDHVHYALTEFRVKKAIPTKFIVGVMKKKAPEQKMVPATKVSKPQVNMRPAAVYEDAIRGLRRSLNKYRKAA